MILTVTLNPALDLTYAVDELRPHATHRVRAVHERPGGKGLNVASVLHAQGEAVLATGLLGGSVGAAVRALVDAAGLPSAFVPIAGETRRTVTVAHGGDATGLWEPGPFVTASEWAGFLACYGSLLSRASVVTLSGSLPRGVPPDAYAALIRLARSLGVPCVLDASGEALRLGLAAGPDLVKPNAAELAELTKHAEPDETGYIPINALKSPSIDAPVAPDAWPGARGPLQALGSPSAGAAVTTSGAHGPPQARESPPAGAAVTTSGAHGPPHARESAPAVTPSGARGPLRALGPSPVDAPVVPPDARGPLRALGKPPGEAAGTPRGLLQALRSLPAGATVLSLGPKGLLAVTPEGCWRAAPPAALPGNPTGAGDACVAALARGLRDRTPWPQLLADAVALSAAAVAAPVAGAVDEAEYRRIRPLINVEEYDDADANG